ncbi:tRNA pseudouridine(13) synthase TruD [Acidihalobacter aeolianus]|uniref:tRNA pseudouridine synthase D n=1 Tax=Acidihalobacter aeolianus TaxID=2792603 RepID=A0A1D8KCB5_9GAMM|nr:tRNA pseudouridine(13) synthase TruD [Acidihalobacter aeolianus]
MESLPRHASPPISAVIRRIPEDFWVDEIPVTEPNGEGEHLWVFVEKRSENTAELANRLARAAGIRKSAVSYAGRKDRHALTRQWFSLHMPGLPDPSIEQLAQAGLNVLRHARHTRKLRIGALRGNRFSLCLREVEGERSTLDQCLQAIAEHGVPNYFGEQRFGRAGGNLAGALAMFEGRTRPDRERRSLYLSAARSALFNAILAERVRTDCWNCLLPGEAVQLDGSGSFFVTDAVDGDLPQRLDAWDIHPSGALWGAGEPPSHDRAGALEREVASRFPDLAAGLRAAGMKQERRPLRVRPADLTWRWEDAAQSDLILEFTLPAGVFATAVLREIADYTDAAASAPTQRQEAAEQH